MKLRIILFILMVFHLVAAEGQIITCSPAFPTPVDAVTITFYADQGNKGLKDYTGDVYAHTGVITDKSANSSDWRYVISTWSVNIPKAKMTRVSPNVYTLTISPSINGFYGVAAADTVKKLAFVFRSYDGSREGKTATGGDIFYDVNKELIFAVTITSPEETSLLVAPGDVISVTANASKGDSLKIFDNDTELAETSNLTLTTSITASGSGLHKIVARGWDKEVSKADSMYYFVRGEVVIEDVPQGMRPGVNITGDNSATFVLYAPGKNNVFVIGDFSDWQYRQEGYMKKSTDGNYFWLEVTDLDKDTEYGFQYVIDGSLRIPDPYATKILDPSNDSYITSAIYPNLKKYPVGRTTDLVSVFQTRPAQYSWKNTSFTPPAKQNLVIYEVLVRDFVAAHDFKTIRDTLDYFTRLGINAIEFMPVSEFEGNSSWGYNPSMYFAVDKYYGPANSFKELIDSCHSRGIAVIMDMVLNHAYGSNPLVRMYYDKSTYKVTAENPWFNIDSPNSSYSWGYDFNHESHATQSFVDSVNHYWINEFKIDGFRFDFTKGFTNTAGDGWAYDASRIDILKRMGEKIWSYKPDAFLILEHFTDNSEEISLSNSGFMLWGNAKGQYQEASMGYTSDLTKASWLDMGWSVPGLLDYMESHDEERIMYKNKMYGNANSNYSVKDFNIALARVKLCALFFFTVPGPKMIWQFEELGYDYTIGTDMERLAPKPIRWDFYTVAGRRNVYDNFKALIELKKKYATFSTGSYSMYQSGKLKRLNLIQADMDAVVVGNFDIVKGYITANFSRTGKWYEFFRGDSVDVTNDNMQLSLNLNPGEYRLYTSKRLKRPTFLLSVEDLPSSMKWEEIYAFPNPFETETRISLDGDDISERTLQIFSVSGVLILERRISEGIDEITWDGRDNSGKKVPPGLYFVRIGSGGKYSFGKIIRK